MGRKNRISQCSIYECDAKELKGTFFPQTSREWSEVVVLVVTLKRRTGEHLSFCWSVCVSTEEGGSNPVAPDWGLFVHLRTFGNNWRHFWLSKQSGGSSWHLAGGGQGCHLTSYKAQSSFHPYPNTTKSHSASNVQISLSWRLINHGLVHPVGKCGAEGGVEVGECSLSE